MIKPHPHLRLIKPKRKAAAPKFSIPDKTENYFDDINELSKHWMADQMIDRKRDDFICDREDFKRLIGWGSVTWKQGMPYLSAPGFNLGTHRIRVPGTRFA